MFIRGSNFLSRVIAVEGSSRVAVYSGERERGMKVDGIEVIRGRPHQDARKTVLIVGDVSCQSLPGGIVVRPDDSEKCKRKLDPLHVPRFLSAVLRQVLVSKLHRAMISAADVEYEGSIEIPTDLMEVVGLWEGEKVLVASISTGNRLETYVQPGLPGTGKIIINGGAAHLIKKGERVAIMAFGLSETPVKARKAVLNDENQVIRGGR